MCDKDHRVNFCWDLCEVVNKEGNILITRHRTMDNCYAINPNLLCVIGQSLILLSSNIDD